jgi:hypothetical protein
MAEHVPDQVARWSPVGHGQLHARLGCAAGADVTSVISNRGCVGFVLNRRGQFEAHDAEGGSLGLYDTQQAAIEKILRHSECELTNERTTD